MSAIVDYFRKFNNYINLLNQSGENLSKTQCAIDGIVSFIIFGSTITDYFELSFWNKTLFEKAKYATWRLHKRFIYEVDEIATIERLTNKYNMYDTLKKYVNREQLYSKVMSFDDFADYCTRHSMFFAKPCNNSCGEGIERIDVNLEDLDSLYLRLIKEETILESPIVQHHDMLELNHSSVNTLRIFTYRVNDCIYYTGCALRIGTTGYIDNYSAGGLVCSVDLKTGKTKAKAENHLGQRFSEHPLSHVKLESFQVPRWNEVIDYVFQMAQNYDLNYVAWDIAVEENGVDLVEANPAGMINVIQIAGGDPKKEIIKSLEKEWKKDPGKKNTQYKMILC